MKYALAGLIWATCVSLAACSYLYIGLKAIEGTGRQLERCSYEQLVEREC